MFPNSRVFGPEFSPLPLSSKGGFRFPSWPARLPPFSSCSSPRPPRPPLVSRLALLSPKNQNGPDQRHIPRQEFLSTHAGDKFCFSPVLRNSEFRCWASSISFFDPFLMYPEGPSFSRRKTSGNRGDNSSMTFISTGFSP
jgi:hypothetical protein